MKTNREKYSAPEVILIPAAVENGFAASDGYTGADDLIEEPWTASDNY